MDIHRQIAAWLSIATGALGLLALSAVVLMFGSIAALIGLESNVMATIASIGLLVASLVGAFAAGDVIAGICYLRGSGLAKVWLILSNLLFLFAFPIGTAIGLYSLWAILRTPMLPQVGHQGAPSEV
jgi:hypothetical protein